MFAYTILQSKTSNSIETLMYIHAHSVIALFKIYSDLYVFFIIT